MTPEVRLAELGDVARLLQLMEAFSLADHILWHAERVSAGVSKLIASEDLGFVVVAEKDHLTGLVWFNKFQDDGPHHQDWLLKGRALTAFRKAAKSSR